MNTSSKLLALLLITGALAACGGGDAAPVAQAAVPLAADPLDDLAANAAPSEAVMPPGDAFEAEFPAAAQVPDATS